LTGSCCINFIVGLYKTTEYYVSVSVSVNAVPLTQTKRRTTSKRDQNWETIMSRSETRLTLTSFPRDVLKSETRYYSLRVVTLSIHNTKLEVGGYEDASHSARDQAHQVQMRTAPREQWLRPVTESIIRRNDEIIALEKRGLATL
jgi:hypothetical protein